MPKLLVEDTAPFLSYSEGHWRPGLLALEQFTGNSFAVANVSGATVSFTFYGTAVEIFGAKRGNHGLYRVVLDDKPYEVQNASAATPEFRASLFSVDGLPRADHTVVLENREAAPRDIDFITWEQSIGQDGEPSLVYTIQDSDPAFTYEPAEKWRTDPPFVVGYSGGSGHATNEIGAKAKLRFKGDAIALYGPAGAEAANVYSVQLNNRPVQSFSATTFQNPVVRPKQLMYFGSNLGRGEHELVVTLASVASAQQVLAIDYAEIFTTPSIGGPSSSTPIGLLAAIAVTGALAALSLSFTVWVLVLVRKGRIRRSSELERAHPNPSKFLALFFPGRHRSQGPEVVVPYFPEIAVPVERHGQSPTVGPPTGQLTMFSLPTPLTRKGQHESVTELTESRVPPPLYSAT